MIGIVIVSHSAKLAEGVVELARGMGGPDLLIRAAGGLDLPGQPLGTDPMVVLAAIEQVYSEEGVLVLMDLGSAVLSAEMALGLLPPEKRARVLLCEASIVEGAVAAAVQARLGNSLEQAAGEARGALSAKASHLGHPDGLSPAVQPTSPPAVGAEIELHITVNNSLGLHARPAARLVQAAGRFPQVKILVTNLTAGRGPANASSINALATLGIRRGHEVLVTLAGAGAEAARAALQTLAAENFGDRETTAPPAQQRQPEIIPQGDFIPEEALDLGSRMPGLPISPGIATGPAHRFQPVLPQVDDHLVSDPQAEWEGLLAALAKTRAQIQANRDAAAPQTGAGTASILEAHLLFLDDEALRGPAHTAIFDARLNAGAAWNQAIQGVAAGYRSLDDPYLQARAADVEDVGRQVLFNLLGSQEAPLKFEQPGILVAANLSLADAARLDPQVVLGICLAYGSPISHSSILVRSLGIPAVGGLGEEILQLADGTILVVDSEHAEVHANPGEDAIEEYTRRSQARRSAHAAELAASTAPAITRDGRRIEVAANIASAAEARAAVSSGAESVGVFRTEFLFLNRAEAPGEDEQYAVYRSAAEGLAGRSLIIRTLDAGGDKPIPYLNLPVEANPFLGVRAVRLCLARPELFKTQLRAILRTAVDFPVKVMYPMIALHEEWQAASRLLAEARDELRRRGNTALDRIDAGIMVEIPSAALCAARFADEVDFFSIGTNDLVQYTLAAERGNPQLAALADGFHPAVLELIYRVAEAAHSRGKWAGVCGEMAGDPLAVPVLVGLGIDELSMNAPAIPRVKQVIRFSDYSLLRGRASELLTLPTAQAVRKAAALMFAPGVDER